MKCRFSKFNLGIENGKTYYTKIGGYKWLEKDLEMTIDDDTIKNTKGISYTQYSPERIRKLNKTLEKYGVEVPPAEYYQASQEKLPGRSIDTRLPGKIFTLLTDMGKGGYCDRDGSRIRFHNVDDAGYHLTASPELDEDPKNGSVKVFMCKENGGGVVVLDRGHYYPIRCVIKNSMNFKTTNNDKKHPDFYVPGQQEKYNPKNIVRNALKYLLDSLED